MQPGAHLKKKKKEMSAHQPGSYYYQGLLVEGLLLGSLSTKRRGKSCRWSLSLFRVEKLVLLK